MSLGSSHAQRGCNSSTDPGMVASKCWSIDKCLSVTRVPWPKVNWKKCWFCIFMGEIYGGECGGNIFMGDLYEIQKSGNYSPVA